MKSAALVLALLTSAVQTVGWVECCCVLVCKHRNDPCKDECKDKQEAPTVADCCSKKTSQPAHHDDGRRCAHVEPSSEVVAQSAGLPPLVFDLVLDLPVVSLLPPLFGTDKMNGSFCRSRGSPPLHLLYSVLLI